MSSGTTDTDRMCCRTGQAGQKWEWNAGETTTVCGDGNGNGM